MNVKGGFELVWIGPDAVTDPHFSKGIWLTLISPETNFEKSDMPIILYNGTPYNEKTKYTFELICYDMDKLSDIETLIKSNGKVQVFAFGEKCLQWREAVTVNYSNTSPGNPDETAEFKLVFNYEIKTDNIICSKNMLPLLFRTGDATTYTTPSGCTYTSATKNGSFTTGSGKVNKIVQTATGASGKVSLTGWKFPAKSGMKFSFFSDEYDYNGTVKNAGIILSGLDSSGASSEDLQLNVSNGGLHALLGSAVFAVSTTTQFQFCIYANSTSGTVQTAEFDNLALCYGSRLYGFFND